MRRSLAITTVLVALAVSCGVQQETQKKTREQECPTWFIPLGNQTSNCKCGVEGFYSMVVVKCDEHSKQSMILSSFCMGYNEATNMTVVGACPYNSHKTDYRELYVKLPQNVSHLNEFMCGGLNRSGPLCSHCKEGLGIPVFSYRLHCLPCLGSLSGWLLYILLAVFPTTIFFLIVIIFQVRLTSAPMNAFIFGCQVLVNMLNSNPYTFLNSSKLNYYAILVLSVLYGVWNLDFFRYVIPSFCVSDQLTPIQVVALEYVVAFYPLLLIFITYTCVELYAKDCRLMVWLWRPFRRCLVFALRGREISFSFVHAFSSFLLLSYSKILFVSFQLLSATNFNDPSGQMVGRTLVYYDASIEYFSPPHHIFVILAIFAFCVFVVFPALVLLLYPARIFQRCLGCCRVRWLALHAFADTFNGYYKNGTKGTRDYRYFAGLYVILRIVLLPPNNLGFIYQYYWILTVVCSAVTSLLFAILRPYKENWINVLDSLGFALLTFGLLFIMYAKYIASLPLEVVGVITTLPFIYIIVYVMYKHTNAFQNCYVFLNKCRANVQFGQHMLLNIQTTSPKNGHTDCDTPAGPG